MINEEIKLDSRFAYEHILYELCKHDVGKCTNVTYIDSKVNMIMKVLSMRKVIGREHSHKISVEPDGKKTLHLKWSGVGAGDMNIDIEFDMNELVRENAEAVQLIAQITTA